MAIADYLNKLVQLKNDLITTLRNKGVEVSDDEKLNTLVPKVEGVEGEQSVEFIDDVPEDFNFSDAIKSVIIPYGVKNITANSFYYHSTYCPWSNLEKIVIPMSVESIEKSAFYNCPGNVTVPRNAVVGEKAFYNATTVCPSEGTDITNAPWGAYLGDIHDFDENGICKICGHKAKIFCTEPTIPTTFTVESYVNSKGKIYTLTSPKGTYNQTSILTVFEEMSVPIIFSGTLFYWATGQDSMTVTITNTNTQEVLYEYSALGAKNDGNNVNVNTTITLPTGTYNFDITTVRLGRDKTHSFTLPMANGW